MGSMAHLCNAAPADLLIPLPFLCTLRPACLPAPPLQGLQADPNPGGQPGRQLQDHIHGDGQPCSGGIFRWGGGGRGGGNCCTLFSLCLPACPTCLPACLPACLPRICCPASLLTRPPRRRLPPAESLSTLKFANRAKCMRNLPKVGRPPFCCLLQLNQLLSGLVAWNRAACAGLPACLPVHAAAAASVSASEGGLEPFWPAGASLQNLRVPFLSSLSFLPFFLPAGQ